MNQLISIHEGFKLSPYSTLRSGGNADFAAICRSSDEIELAWQWCKNHSFPLSILGSGSNVLVSDRGIRGLTVINFSNLVEFTSPTTIVVDSGVSLQNVFLTSVKAGLRGLEFAVGIPGTLGGALVSNAGAYRSSIGQFVKRLEVIADGERKWVPTEWLKLSYRNSRLRTKGYVPNMELILKVELELENGDPLASYRLAKEYQKQRISKQPPGPSAGSFFKNVVNREFAMSLSFLPDRFKDSGVVPAGFLIEAAGLKGYRLGRAGFGIQHANFIVNYGEKKSSVIRELASIAKLKVFEQFGQELEEEVLYFGDWSHESRN